MPPPAITLTVVSLILLLVFWGILLYLSSQGINSLLSTSSNPYLQNCPTGQCATNIYSGEKRCPTDDSGVVSSNITIELCNPRGSCTAGRTPYAVNTDGSTNIQGICEPGIACRCVEKASCANYITTFFQTLDGNPYVSTNGQRTRFRQGLIDDMGQFPDTFNPITTFCQIPADWLPRSAPGCTFDSAVTPKTITECMDPNNTNPCLAGTLAFVTTFPTFDASQIDRAPVACVEGKPCPSGQVAVYDIDYKGIICQTII
jgi:hypothetical protein